VRFQFDPNQSWQLEAIAAVVDTFAGQGRQDTAPSPTGHTNQLQLGPDTLLANVRKVQARHDLALSEGLTGLELSVEMETGTGKTYTYLRTLHALYHHYGWSRFCIAVPSVAIREGVLQTLHATAEHFEDLYSSALVSWHVYDGNQTGVLRSFARDPGIQILIMNIDAFNKRDHNLIYRSDDRLGGLRPMDLLASTRPVLVIDEPQNMESTLAQQALASLTPLCTLRYSATHRTRHHQVYQLDPVRAHGLGLVKSVHVCSVTDASARPWIGIGEIRQRPLRARIEVASGPRKACVVRVGEDLGKRSGRDRYAGWVVEAIEADAVQFTNGHTVATGESWGDTPEAVARAQIEETVRLHLEQELAIRDALGPGKMKVLSLFFIDRVARYIEPDAPIRQAFEEAWTRLIARERYASLGPFPEMDRVHGGYFAMRRSRPVDTRGRSKADEDAYRLIMKDKQRLLDPQEPLRFIFSHSALREGWDNPNVFVICTLANAHSTIRKRQEIGRGLRLPVTQEGRRCWDPTLNRLTLVANHSYKRFAEALQREHRSAWGPTPTAPVHSPASVATGQAFLSRWAQVAKTLQWALTFDTEALISLAADRLRRAPPAEVGLRISSVGLGPKGAVTSHQEREATPIATPLTWPDLLDILSQRTSFSRGTVAQVLVRSGRLTSGSGHPERLLADAEEAMRAAAQLTLGGAICVEQSAGTWQVRIARDVSLEGEQLDLPPGFAVSTPLGAFRPSHAVWQDGLFHLSRRRAPY
jgi:type III restriction enzyme